MSVPTTGVTIRAAALACALGNDLDSAADRLLAGSPVAPRRVTAGEDWPYFAVDIAGNDWMERAERIARAVARDLKTRAGLAESQWSELPCIVGSSSYSVGAGDGNGWPSLEMPLDFCDRLARWFGVRGPAMAVTTACTSGLGAIALASQLIAAGAFREALVLGVELSNRLTVAGFAGLELLSRTGARPCDRDRDGMVLGEAFGAILLSAEPAAGSDAWHLRALASGMDAASLTGPSPDGAAIARTMREAMMKARWNAETVDLVKLQASGSHMSDAAEAHALRALFSSPRAVSLKGSLGHTLGASGPAELALLARCLERGRVPRTWGFSTPDETLGLTPSNETANADADNVRRVLFNLSGFGGNVMTLALERNA